MKDFAHLHVHTEYSLLDGIARIKPLIKTVKERGWTSIAMTDHGNMYGALQFYGECLANHINPIIGTEFYICHDLTKKVGKADMGHLVILAKDNEGYQNLLKLNSIAFVDGFYYKPRIDYDTLEKYSKGLVCLSACLAGHIPSLLLQHRFDEADALALRLKKIFGEDFYLEIQNHGLDEQIEILPYLKSMSERLGIKLVATNDVHYINKEDAEIQDVLMCVQMGKTIDDPDRMRFSTNEFYLKTREEMEKALEGYEDALDTTLEIAQKCQNLVIKSKAHGDIPGIDPKYVLASNQNYIPKYIPDTGETAVQFLRRMTWEGIRRIYGENYGKVIEDRTNMELDTIESQGFVEYFLVVWDYVNYAKSQGIPVGPGRGSGAGSIVAYAIGITMVDPIKYDLIFERFINKERVSMPDFDIDFCFDRRLEVVEYTRRRYGKSNVALIVTFGTMAAKNAIRDVARVLRMPLSQVDKMTKLIPGKLPDGIKKPPVLKYYFGTTGDPANDKFIIPDLRKEYDEDPFVKRVADLAIKLEGAPRNTSTHAAGVLIAPEPVDNYVPLSKNGDDVATQYNMIELESLGLLKMDFLGLKTLTDIDRAIKLVKQTKGIDIDFYHMEYDDQNVYGLISSGNTDSIFQLESGGFKNFMRELQPDCLEDIIAGVSLYRPGPMDSIPRYIEGKKNPKSIVYADPCLEPILNKTYGCIVYQEQVMQIFQAMGGYSFAQADNVRRIMGKKKKDKMPAEKQKFIYGQEGEHPIPGALKLGIPEEVALKVFAEMESFASYAFNKSHAAAYAYLSYQTAYLKCYHEVEFLTAVINNRITNLDEIKKYVMYAKKEGIEVLLPDINKSGTYFTVENGKMRFGLAALKNVGVGVVESIIAEREKNGPYKDFMDYCERVNSMALNKRCLEAMIMAGAFDCFKVKRSQLMMVFERAVEIVSKDKKTKETGQTSLFDFMSTTCNTKFSSLTYPDVKEFSKDAKLKNEKEIAGIYLSGHPLDDYLEFYNDITLTSDMLVKDEDETSESQDEVQEEKRQFEDGQQFKCGGLITEVNKKITKSNKEMAFLRLEDMYGEMEVIVFPGVYAKFKNILQADNIVGCIGKISYNNDKFSLVADGFREWKKQQTEEVHQKSNRKLYLRFDTTNDQLYQNVLSLLKEYIGDDEIAIRCTNSGKSFKVSITTNADTMLCNDLIGLLGQENVIVKGGEEN